ncbi:MAG: S41 family peptidase, partial [Phycisphaerae bacterium]|nr:S41 family peptidase [Phycisphaerae bacterium]
MPSHTLAEMKKPHASSDSHYFQNGFLSMKRLCLAVMAILAAAAFLSISGGCLSAFPEGEYWPVREQANALATPAELETTLRKAADVRWSDTGFVRSASRMSTWTGLAVYEELARTILLNYVEEVSCSDMVRSGLRNLKASLDADAFRKHFDVMGDPGRLAQFKKRLDGIDHAVALTETNSVAEAKRWIELVLAENERSVDLPPGVVLAEFILGAADSLDRYSLYMTPQMLAVFKERMRGKYVGVGISVGVEKGEVVVKSVIANSPAEKSEIAVGDKIISVDDKTLSADSLGEVVRTIRGPKGTQVRLTVRRPGEKEEREIVLTRARVIIPSVRDAKMIEEGVGYVAVDAFNSDTARDLSGTIAELKREKMSGLVLDLRNNPGGLLFSAVSVCGVFTRGERVATTTGRGIWEGWKYDVSP